MVTTIEELDQGANELQLSSVPGASSRWSFSPLQAIPRNAEALWNLVESVYFANIPSGHELLECLSNSAKDAYVRDLPVDSNMAESPTVEFSYKYDGQRTAPPTRTSSMCRIDVLYTDEGMSVLYADCFLPLSTPPSRRQVAKGKPDQSGTATPTPCWSLESASSNIPMSDGVDEVEREIAFIKAELVRVQDKKEAIIGDIMAKVQSEVRPNRKAWFEAEQNVLALYERKPPSSFQSSAGVGEIKELSLNALGKVDTELPDSFKDAELCCCICGEGDTTDDNDILICDGCSFAAHQSCYFVSNIPDGSWYCQLCDSYFKSKGGRKNSKRLSEGQGGLPEYLESIHCSLCLQTASFVGGGLMKPTSTSTWAHVKCALWVPEAAFPPDGLTIKVIPNKERENLRCSLCKLKGGCPVQCAFGKCTSAFHVSCASKAGLLPEEKNLKNLFCYRHIKIQLKMSPSTSRLLSLRKQDSYMKAVQDKYVAPKIGGSLFTPSFNPELDGEQSFLLQFAALHPIIFREIAGPAFLGPQDMMELEQVTGPLLKDFYQDLVSFPALVESKGGPSDMGKEVFIDLSCCSECMRPISESRDLVVKCTTCGLYAHALCYDRGGVPAFNLDDLGMPSLHRVLKYDAHAKFGGRKFGCVSLTCTRCELVNMGTVSAMAKTYCLLCMQMGGLVLPLQDLDENDGEEQVGDLVDKQSKPPVCFAHPRCVWWLLASSLTSLTSSPVMQIKSIAASYHFHMCAVCGSRQGCTIRCARVGCNKRFHISCGFHAGAFFTVRSPNGVIAGCRDAEEDSDLIIDNISAALGGKIQSRRLVTCWAHEQRGLRRSGGMQLGRAQPSRTELVRWVPEGIRSDLVGLVNRVLAGDAVGLEQPSSSTVVTKRKIPPDHPPKKRGRPLKPQSEESGERKMQTVRFVDGMEVTCEDEDWEGGCSLCGKAWTDSKGQVLESICCDRCDQWYHFSCVGIEKAPSGDFICPPCLGGTKKEEEE
jgi:hypothetical protein